MNISFSPMTFNHIKPLKAIAKPNTLSFGMTTAENSTDADLRRCEEIRRKVHQRRNAGYALTDEEMADILGIIKRAKAPIRNEALREHVIVLLTMLGTGKQFQELYQAAHPAG